MSCFFRGRVNCNWAYWQYFCLFYRKLKAVLRIFWQISSYGLGAFFVYSPYSLIYSYFMFSFSSRTTQSNDCFNGGISDKYSWSQTISDVDIKIPVPDNIKKAKDVLVEIKGDSIKASLKQDPPPGFYCFPIPDAYSKPCKTSQTELRK